MKKTFRFFLFVLFVLISSLCFSQNQQGDVNKDGIVNIIDALKIAQFTANKNPKNFYPEYADVDGNGKIDNTDTNLTAQYYVGAINEFPKILTESPYHDLKFVAENEQEDSDYGNSVSISDDGKLIAIGQPQYSDGADQRIGAVWIYQQLENGQWAKQIITSPEPIENSYFGENAVISGNGMVLTVAAPNEIESDSYLGCLHIYNNVDGNWEYSNKLKFKFSPKEPNFGKYLSISDDGNTIVCGSHQDFTLYIYRNIGGNWMSYPIKASTIDWIFNFSASPMVSNDGNQIVTGVYCNDETRHIIVLYKWNNINENWDEVIIDLDSILNPLLLENCRNTTAAIAGNGNIIAAGLDNGLEYNSYICLLDIKNIPTLINKEILLEQGIIPYVFTLDNKAKRIFVSNSINSIIPDYSLGEINYFYYDGTDWINEKIFACDGIKGDSFGLSLVVTGDSRTLIAGAPRDSNVKNQSGSFYSFKLNSLISTWSVDLDKAISVSSVNETSTEDLVICGCKDGKIFLTKYDKNGNVLWEKTYTDRDNPQNNLTIYRAVLEDNNPVWQIQDTYQGNWGFTNSYSSSLGSNDSILVAGKIEFSDPDWNEDMYMLKFDKEGNYLWSVILSGTSTDDAVWEIKETSDGGYIAAAVTHSPEVTGDPGTELDYLLIKLTTDGKLEYTHRYGNSGIANFTSTLLEANDGHYILGGNSFTNPLSPLVIKVSKTNNDVLWTYDGTNSSEIIPHTCEEVLAVKGGYLVFGDANGDIDTDISIVMLDENGQFVWQKLIPYEGNEALDREYPCRVTSDNGIIIGAKTSLNYDDDSSFLLLKLNKDYDLEWSCKYWDNSYDELIKGIVETQDGGYVFIGYVKEDYSYLKTVIYKVDESGLF